MAHQLGGQFNGISCEEKEVRSVSCCSGTFWLEALLPASWHTELVLVSMLAIGWTPRDDAAEDMAARPAAGPPKSQLEWAARPLRPPVIDLTGAPDDEKHEFMEVYSPPRVAPVLHRRQPGAYLSIDIDTGYDLSRFDVRRTVVQLLQTHRPTFLMLSPPCTMFSKLQNCNRKRVDPERQLRRLAEATLHLDFAMLLARLQSAHGRFFCFEHPAGASSWQCPSVQALVAAGARKTVFDQCRFNLRHPVTQQPMRKRTAMLSNSAAVAELFGNKMCACDEPHYAIQGPCQGMPLSRLCQRYTPELCDQIARCALAHS